MESLRDVGNVMGEYAGDGQGDVQATVSVGMESGDADAGVVYEQPVDLEEEVSTDAEPFLFFYMIVRQLGSVSTMTISRT